MSGTGAPGSRRLGVVVNPVAGHGRGRLRGADALAALRVAGHDVLDLSRDGADAALAAARAALPDLDALVVVGGDGMAHLGVNAVAGTDTPLGVIAVGSGNDLARTVGLPVHDVDAGVRVLGECLVTGPRPVDAIEAEAGARTEWTLCVLSAGFDAAVNHRANTYAWPRGGLRYVRGVLGELARFRPYGYRMTLDGVTREFRGTLVAFANAGSIGGGMRIAPDASMVDGLIDVVVATDVTRGELLRVFPRVFKGTHVTHPAVEVIRAREVRLEALPGEPAPPPVFADGEYLGELPVLARVRPGAIGLLAP